MDNTCAMHERIEEHIKEGDKFRDKIIRIEVEVEHMTEDIKQNSRMVKFWGALLVASNLIGFTALFLKS